MARNNFNYKCDYHVHIGQFHNVYYNPYKIIDVLSHCGISSAYVSSTTSCIKWETQQEKDIIVEHIRAEFNELLLYSQEKQFDAKPMCWVIPQRYYEGDTVENMYTECDYHGFKIHPRAHSWNIEDDTTIMLLSDICKMAESKKVPILIHTGMCDFEKPNKFEYWFKTFPNVKFILAHCRDVEKILDLFDTYSNLYGDVAFSTPKDMQQILSSVYCERLLFGSDFPITAYRENMKAYRKIELYENYQKILSIWNKHINSFNRKESERK